MLFYQKKGKGPAIVLLHGMPLDHTLWNGLTDELQNRFTFLMPDFPGAGKSPERKEGFLLNDMAHDVMDILEKEHINQSVIAGHSMGGYTAMACARLFPEKIKAVSLIHSTADVDTQARRKTRQKAIRLMQRGERAKVSFIKALVRNLFAASFVEQYPKIVNRVFELANQPSVEAVMDYYKAIMERDDNREILTQVPFPFQWILGTDDSTVEIKDALSLAKASDIADICVYRNCGHMSMYESPELLKNDLRRFWHFIYND